MKKPIWTRAAVLITVGPEEKPGEWTVAGWICDAAPGLAVSRSFRESATVGTWSVTHKASGGVLADCLGSEKAKRVAIAIAPLADWLATVPVPKPAPELLQLAVVAVAESHRRAFRPL